jgi:hypothetical protein
MKHFNPNFFLVVLLLHGFFIPAFSQKPIQLSVNFKKNKYVLTDEAKAVLEKVKDTIGDYVLDKIVVKGYTDSDADSVYNAKLSENRCKAVKDFLVADGIDASKISTAAYGEYFPLVENSSENNKSKNRRVDLIITMHFPQLVKITPLKKDSCVDDTLIEVSNGVMMLVNKCNYVQKKSCIQVSVQRQVITKTKVNRFKMKLGLKNYMKTKVASIKYYAYFQCPDSTCADKNTTIYIPTYEVKEKKVTVQDYDTATGEYSKSRVPKIKSLKKKTYAAVPFKCNYDPGRVGGSCMMICCGGDGSHCGCKTSVLKFKDGIKVLRASAFGSSSSIISADSSSISFYPEYGIMSLKLEVNGDTIQLNDIQLTALKHGLRRSKMCDRNKWLLFVRIRKRCDFYRKYRFRYKDIEIQKELMEQIK